MFDKINFFTHDEGFLNQNNFAESIRKDMPDEVDSVEYNQDTEVQIRNRFTADGSMKLLFPFPITDEERKHFLCPQFFVLTECGPHFYYRRKNFDSFLIQYTYEGNGLLEYEGKTYHLKKGDGVLIDCRKPHYYRTDGNWWLHADLHFNGGYAEKLYSDYKKWADCSFHENMNESFQSLLEKLALTWNRPTSYKLLKCSNCISEIMAHLLTLKSMTADSDPIPDTFVYLTRYIDCNYSRNLTLDYLAEFASMSKYHLSREFKKHIGLSPVQYVIFVRIENAKLLLRMTELPVYQIAQRVGFTDINSFINVFRKHTGKTPKAFRQSMRR